MPRPVLATIDLAALRHNLAQARARAGRRSIWAVVKANARGASAAPNPKRFMPVFSFR
jgi:alanine racemase